MNLMSGLMAGANFGVGYQQGQMNAIQMQMQKLALANAQVLQQQQAQKMQQQQALSDYAMATFTPSITDPVTGQPIGGGGAPTSPSSPQMALGVSPSPPTDSLQGQPPQQQQGQPQPDNSQPAPTDPIDQTIARMDQLANKAASLGDLDHYTQFATNATNMRMAQSQMAQHGAAAQLAEARRQMINYQQVAGMFADLDPTSPTFAQDFKDRQLAAESLPTTSQEEAQNIAQWQPTPNMLRAIVSGGMNASQQAAARHQQLTQQETQRHNQAMESIDQQRNTIQATRNAQLERDKQNGAKVGKIVPSPTSTDIATAANVVAPIVFPDGQIDSNNPDFKMAVTTLASRAKAYQQQHTEVPYTTALATVAQQAKSIGEFTPTTEATGGFLGMGQHNVPGPQKFQAKGDSSNMALPLPSNPKSPKSYIPNKYYNVPGHGPMMWVVKPDGTAGFDPNS